MRSNYAGYDLLGKDYYDENRNGPLREELYLGPAKNYDNKGNYDNSDGELIFVSDNPRIWGLLAGDGYTVSQQRLIDENDFRESDYEEYYRLNYEGGRLESLPKTCEVRFCAGRGEGPDSGVPFRYPDWERKDPETVRLDEEERKVADARAEVRDYRGLEAEDEEALLLYRTKAGPEGEYRVYGDKAPIAAALCGCPVERRDLGFGISPLTAKVREEDLAGALGALHPVFRVWVVSGGRTVAMIPRLDGAYLPGAGAAPAEREGGGSPAAGSEDAGSPAAAPDDEEDRGYGDEDGEPDGFRGDGTMLRVRGETALIMHRMGIDVYSCDDLSPVSSRDTAPDGVYAIRKSAWDAFTASDGGKGYMYVLKNLEDATADYLASLGAGRDVLDVLRDDAEETARSFAGRDPGSLTVSAFQTEELLKIFASRTAEEGDAFRGAERGIASRAADPRVRRLGLALVERQEAEAFARGELKALGFSEGLEYGLTDEERARAAELLEGPYGERMARVRPGSYADYLAGPLGEALFSLSAAGDPRDRRAEVKDRVEASYASFMRSLRPAETETEEALRAYGTVTAAAIRDAVEGNLLSDGAYRALSEEDDPLRGIYDELTEKDYPYVASGAEAAPLVEGYCARFHPETVERTPACFDDDCPVYAGSRAFAAAEGETAAYERSLSADMRCARDIEDSLRDGFPRPGAVEEITRRYGGERVDAVIMRHLSGSAWDERFSSADTGRAEALHAGDLSTEGAVFEADAETLNAFIKTYQRLGEEKGNGTFSRALPGERAAVLTEYETDENPFADEGTEAGETFDTPAEEAGTHAPAEDAEQVSPAGDAYGEPFEERTVFSDPIPAGVLSAGGAEEETGTEEAGESAPVREETEEPAPAAEETRAAEAAGATVAAETGEAREPVSAAGETPEELPEGKETEAGEIERETEVAEAAEEGAEKRREPPAEAEKPAGGKKAAKAADGLPSGKDAGKDEKKTVWVPVYISPGDVIRQDADRNTIIVAMPGGGAYAGYEAWIRRSYVFDAQAYEIERFGGPVVKVCLPDDRPVRLYSRGRERVTLGAREFAAAMGGKDGPDDGMKGERVDFEVPDSSLREVRGGYTVLRMPAGEHQGYSVRVPSRYVDAESRRGDGMLAVSLPSSRMMSLVSRRMEFSSMTVSAERLAACMGGASRDDFLYPEDTVPADTGSNTKEEHDLLLKAMREADEAERTRGDEPAEDDAAPEAGPPDDAVSVTVPVRARVMGYGGDGVYAMPRGPFRGYFFHCPDDRASLSEDKGSYTLTFDRYGAVMLIDMVNDSRDEVTPDYLVRQFSGKGAQDWAGGFGVRERADDLYVNGASLGAVPKEMRERRNWVGVRVTKGEDGARYKKLPVDPNTGMFAKSDDPSTWATFDDALSFARSNGCEAVAYALDGKDGICCIDMDGCLDADGRQSAAAKEVLGALPDGAYVERSVSGTGIHVFARCGGFSDLRSFSRDGSMEFYRKSHFMTVTGRTVSPPGDGLVSLDGSGVADILSSRFDRRPDMRSYPGGAGIEGISQMSDREVLERAFRSADGGTMKALYEGNDLKHNRSNSDMALMCRLAFWCNGDKEQMLRIFQTSGLYRPEKSQDYYECTAIKAIRSERDRYGADARPAGGERQTAKEETECEGRTM